MPWTKLRRANASKIVDAVFKVSHIDEELAGLLVVAVSAAVILQWTDLRAGLLVISHIGVLAAGAVAGAGWALRKIAEERGR